MSSPSEAPQSCPSHSDPPIVKAALIGQHTIVALGCVTGIVILALHQSWDSATSLLALSSISGLWGLSSIGTLLRARSLKK